MATHAAPPASAPPSPQAIAVLTRLLEARTGQQLASAREWRIDTALRPLMRQRGLETLDQLVHLLLGGQEPALSDQIVDALVNNETSFFREAPVFDAVVEATTALEVEGRRARLWCAGCSTGQEPLSLAMLFAERRDKTGLAMPEILGTDVSEAVIARARQGRYSQFEIQRGLPIRRAVTWFDGDASGDWIAKPELLRHVGYRTLNLMGEGWPTGRFDVILCRNVLLYLSAEVKALMFSRFAQVLRPGGLLVLGAGETVIGQTDQFQPSARIRGFYEPAVGGGRAVA